MNAGTWIRTKDKLPCSVNEQVDLLMWSPGWATWLPGMFTHYHDGGTWSLYLTDNDKFKEWLHIPEWYCLIETPLEKKP